MNKNLIKPFRLETGSLFKKIQPKIQIKISNFIFFIISFGLISTTSPLQAWSKGIVKVVNEGGRVIEEYLDMRLDNQIIYLEKTKKKGKTVKRKIDEKTLTPEQIEAYISTTGLPTNGKKIKHQLKKASNKSESKEDYLNTLPPEIWTTILEQINGSQLPPIKRCAKALAPIVDDLYKKKSISEIREHANRGKLKAGTMFGSFGGFIIQRNGQVRFFGEADGNDFSKMKKALSKQRVKYGWNLLSGFGFELENGKAIEWQFDEPLKPINEVKEVLKNRQILRTYTNLLDSYYLLNDGSLIKRKMGEPVVEIKLPEGQQVSFIGKGFIILDSGEVHVFRPEDPSKIEKLDFEKPVAAFSPITIGGGAIALFRDGTIKLYQPHQGASDLPKDISEKLIETKAIGIAGNNFETLILFADGLAKCIRDHKPCELPEQVRNEKFVSIAAGNGYNLGILENGKTVMWHSSPELAERHPEEKLPEDILPVF